jgi:hypothetical protein
MPRGGRRPNSGRRPGSITRPKAAAALLQAAPKTGKGLSAAGTLRKLLSEYSSLAATAKAAGDVANFKIWSERSAQIATALLPHELPRLNAVAVAPTPASDTTVFKLKIFETPRRPPVQIEAKPIADNVPAEAKPEAATPEPAAEPAKSAEAPKLQEPQPQPSSTPPAPPQNSNDGPAWARQQRSLWEHPSLSLARRFPWHH